MQHSFVFIVKKRIKDVLEIFGSIEKKRNSEQRFFRCRCVSDETDSRKKSKKKNTNVVV